MSRADHGQVVVPDDVAGELLRLVLLAAREEQRRSGRIPSTRLVDLAQQLHTADRRHATGVPHHQRRAIATSSATTAAPAPMLDAGSSDHTSLTVAQAAAVLGCGRQWVRNLVRRGKISARRPGLRAYAIDSQSLDAYRFGTTQEDQ